MIDRHMRTARTPAEQRKAEADYRRDVLDPSGVWQRHFKATVKNGSVSEIRKRIRELSAATDRLEGFLKNPAFYGR